LDSNLKPHARQPAAFPLHACISENAWVEKAAISVEESAPLWISTRASVSDQVRDWWTSDAFEKGCARAILDYPQGSS
jgi:hypothetical protein